MLECGWASGQEERAMLHTALCDLLRMDLPIIQGAFGPWSSPRLSAAISNAGGLGNLGTAMRSPTRIREDVARLRGMTARSFAVNHTMRPFSEEAFALTLELEPPAISFALGDPGDLVRR